MCGRFNVIDDPITQSIMDLLGIEFEISTNDNVCPSELTSSLTMHEGSPVQVNAHWGIKPDWANKLLINAQSETVAQKRTFKQAFLSSRCLIPISGWYEWKSDDSGTKQKYLFSNDDQAMFMAAILFEKKQQDSEPVMLDLFGEPATKPSADIEYVSLTTRANSKCSPIHSRMPLIIPNNRLLDWIGPNTDKAIELLHADIRDLTVDRV